MKIFYAVSFSNQANDHGEVFMSYREELENLIAVAETAGHEVFCAPKVDKWKINDSGPGEAYKIDITALDGSDAVVAFIDSQHPSSGVSMEVMRAVMQKKSTLVITNGENPVYMIRGMVEQENNIRHDKVSSFDESGPLILDWLNSI